MLEIKAWLEKGHTILLTLSLFGRRHFDSIGRSFPCLIQHSHLEKSKRRAVFLCVVPNLCYAGLLASTSARPVYFFPFLHLQMILTVLSSVSAYPSWYRQGSNFATSKMGGVSGSFDSLSLDLSPGPVSLLSVQPRTRQHAWL